MEIDMVEWGKIAELLPDRETFRDPKLSLRKKKRYIDIFLSDLNDGVKRKILDIGAGTGSFCCACQELGHETLAVLLADRPNRPSSKGYKKACAFFGVPSMDFTWGSEPAPLEDNSFDVVNSQGMLGDNTVDKWETILDDMLRVLKPGGILFLAANHESGTKHAKVINNWGKNAGVERIEYWRKQTLWKWKKLG